MEIWDVGHSNRNEDEFLALLEKHRIETIIDVRRFPTSKKFPHFEKPYLKISMKKANIEYTWLGGKLGGFRKGGYEQWMKTEDFASGMEELENKASQKRTAFMCAEAQHTACHRKYIIAFLEQKGWKVLHITWSANKQVSSLTPSLFFD